jgi:large subunit ribosomal protein L4
MKVPVYNLKGEKLEDLNLKSSYFESKISESLISQAVRVYLANQRQAQAKAKERSEVAGTTKKVWSQKGTGRARHGSRKAPIFVGGGKAHGPSGEQNYSLKLSQKMKQQALKSVLSKFAANNAIAILDDLHTITPKTKVASQLLTGLKSQNEVLSKSSKIGIITKESVENVNRAFANLPKVELMSASGLNVYHLSNRNFLLFTRESLGIFEK